ncbi:superfamily II DNA or RNA helicase [Sedimentibacter acidaminivorans]|uniref:Superfamily II DNA or RNA helicase n=1 Tax=Sedimentibacter acidaminivorans TaxID=913099 RepID=A0ABS4GC50_9FIRM|nr:DEAD/DEAH box helicase [Sedimentibacter acidaminivorans]MBP1925270.1 superfamily II DNA or RNA helicase [Sedimentibacter acidaminivorans]
MSLHNGFYESVINKIINEEIIKKLDSNDSYIDKKQIDKEEANAVLSKYMSIVINKSLRNISGDDKHYRQVELCNKIVSLLKEELKLEDLDDFIINENAQLLLAILNNKDSALIDNYKDKKIRPITSIATNSLFTGAQNEPSLGSELIKEINTADRIDMLVSFIKWSGLVQIYESLKEFTKEHKLRIITTSYMGATDYKAIIELSRLPNTEIKISYDTQRTRLHSKSYMFYRNTGFSTAYIGSSNLSNSALTTGLEWNLKISEYTSKDMIKKFNATFESYWHDNDFYLFNKDDLLDKQKLEIALNTNKICSNDTESQFYFDVIPYSYQVEILDKLQAEREIHNRYKNLIVAATGTGKTVISAFDYKRFVGNNPNAKNRLLFVAHREEILVQSRDCFRKILKDRNFGDLWVGKYDPSQIEHLFISIQTFNSKEFTENIKADYYDYVVIDEFHHSAAPSYRKLLEYINPKILLGMTATPERMDDKDVTVYFDNRIAAEIRLGEAINRKILSSFNYFGITDSVTLKNIKWRNGKYDATELENIYTKDNQRANLVIDSIKKYTKDILEVRGLGFCVSKLHAEYMSQYFNKVGIPSIYLTADSNDSERYSAKNKLENREINFIFVVDLYNEGVDIPSIDTVLFLRPTESITVFLQQLGRGLRLNDGKECLTVLDFVGQANKNYIFHEQKYRALIGNTHNSIAKEIENEFPNLPKGCFIKLERIAKEYILENIKNTLNNKRTIIRKIKDYASSRTTLNVIEFCKNHNVKLIDIYKNYSFTYLCSEAGIIKDFDYDKYKKESKGISRLLHIDSKEWIEFILMILKSNRFNYIDLNKNEKLMLNMFYYTIWQDTLEKMNFNTAEDSINKLRECKPLNKEIISILEYSLENISFKEKSMNLEYQCPLKLHCKYSMAEILAAFEENKLDKKSSFREGVLYLKDKKTDMFFITLNKSEKDYSETTMYDDYAIDDKYFHWQSQSGTSDTSPTGQRYINHESMGSKVVLFVREKKKVNGITEPYYCLGTARFVSYEGSKPMSIVWKLDNKMPEFIKKKASGNVMVG